jgi:MFS superfamily sulfate permease-like transporter
MERISYMDQTGVYTLKDALITLAQAGVQVLVVGLSTAHVDLLEKLQVIPAVIDESRFFSDFEGLKARLAGSIAELRTSHEAG